MLRTNTDLTECWRVSNGRLYTPTQLCSKLHFGVEEAYSENALLAKICRRALAYEKSPLQVYSDSVCDNFVVVEAGFRPVHEVSTRRGSAISIPVPGVRLVSKLNSARHRPEIIDRTRPSPAQRM
jgi:hypothetical protein